MATLPAAASLDAAEIEKFSALADQWWNPNGPFGALHRMNPVRLGYIRDLAAAHFRGAARAPLAGLKLLDLGCGGGLASAPMARMGARVTAIDAAADAIGAARAHAAETGLDIDFQITTAEALAAQGLEFDLALALEIVEHVADLGAFLAAAAALVRPGGLFVVATINRTAKARALAIVGAERILKWAPAGAHDYEKLVTPEEIYAGASALKWRAPVGVSYDPLGAGWRLSRDISVNYLLAAERPKTL
jgi:2-polyprenyl-6-hydroxyphenyl methylase/3-demethylubiquinone-9 3-methyltransferase